MPRIVAATDLSSRGDRAVHRAILLARARGARLTVITVIDEAAAAALARQRMARAEAELARIVGSFAEAAGAVIDTCVLPGDPVGAVAGYAVAEAADLLVLGRHRDRPIADLLRQTTAERIVALVPCPVLVVSAAPSVPYANVLSAIDFSPGSAAAAASALSFAPQARQKGLHLYPVPHRGLMPEDAVPAALHEAERAEAAWRRRFGIPANRLPIRLVEGGAGGLAGAIAAAGPDLVVLGAHGQGGLAAALLGRSAAALLRDPPCDLLVVQPGPALPA